MTDADADWMPYAPRLLYRDLAGITDPRHVAALRQRDLEIFTTSHGPFCRRMVPNEFNTETMSRLNRQDSFVVVSFTNDRWRRQLGKRRPVTVTRLRREGKR